jgi:hypothetical protein
MSFRRPPSDVNRMTSLRVGNLPFRACIDVSILAIKWYEGCIKCPPILKKMHIFIMLDLLELLKDMQIAIFYQKN